MRNKCREQLCRDLCLSFIPLPMTITEEAVLKVLSFVEEPDLGQDLVPLKIIENVEIDGCTVSFTVVLTMPACSLKQLIHDACEWAIHTGLWMPAGLLASRPLQ